MTAATVHIVDDDASLREALASLLRSVGLACRMFASPREFLHEVPAEGPGCIVSDVRMPGMSGLEFQAALREAGIDLPMILMTGHGDIAMAVQAMKAGAADFLSKPFRDQDLIDAVFLAAERDRARREAAAEATVLSERFASLTSREREVMTLVTAGQMNKQIAYALQLSEVTVKVHRGSMMRKMGARSLAELVRMAGRIGLAAA